MTDYTVAYWQTNHTTLDAGPSFGIDDTAAHISTALDALNADTYISDIVISDNLPVTVTAAQLTSDAAALSLLVNANSTAAVLTLSDTAANITLNFDDIAADSQVTKIVVTDSGTHHYVSLSVSQFVNDSSAVSEIYNADGVTPATVNVSGTGASITTNLDSIEAHASEIHSLIITDNAPLTLTAVQIANDAAALSVIANNNHSGVTLNVVDTAADISANLDALEANRDIASITISDNGAITVTVAQISSDANVLSEMQNAGAGPVVIDVSDIAANISAHLAALNANTNISTITVFDSAPITVSVAQITADSVALGKLVDIDASPYKLAVSDTAAHITTALDTLETNTHVTSIVITNNASIGVDVAQLTSDATALGHLIDRSGQPATLTVTDSAASISAAFDTLNGDAQVTKIIVSNSATNEVTITAAQAGSDGTALGELYNANGTTAAHVEVSDTASAISGAFDALNGNTHVNKIVVSDSATNEVTINASQAGSDTAALGELYKADGVTPAQVEVLDTAADISAAFNALNSNTHVNKIVVSDSATNEVTITATQAATDTTALGELYQSGGVLTASVEVSDTAANISANFNALNNAQFNKIVVTDSGTNEVTISVSQAATDTIALGNLLQANGTTPAQVEVSDIATTISGAFDALNANTHVNKIVVSDSGTNEVTISATQAGADSTALGELYQANGITHASVEVLDTAAAISTAFDALNGNTHVNKIVISDSNEVIITAAQAGTDSAALGELYLTDGVTHASVEVSDTAADISGAFNALNGNTHVNKIVVSDSGTNEVTITATQAATDTTALGELYQSGGVLAAPVEVSDTAANISSHFNALNNAQFNKIVVTDSATNEVTITVTQAATDTIALGDLLQSDGVTAAQVEVLDTAANISTAFDALNGNTHVNKIVVSDSGSNEVTISVSQAGNDGTALGELYQANGVTPASVEVSDTVADVTAALAALNSNTHVNKIVLTDYSATNEVTVTVAQLASDSTAIGELYQSNGTTLANVEVSDTVADVTTALSTLNSNAQVNKIVLTDYSASNEVAVTVAQLSSDATAIAELYQSNGTTHASVEVLDNAANISGAFDALNSNTHVNKIVVSDSATNEVTITAAQAAADTTALGELYQSGGTTAASVEVLDTAAHISTAFDALSGNTHVNKIVVSDSATNEVTITVAQLTNDTTALAELFQANGTTAADVAVSDTAAHITADLSGLNSNVQVNKIIVSDSATNEVSFSIAQLTGDATVLSELYQSNGTTLATVAVSDTAANITTALSSLNSNGRVNKIIVTDSASNEVVVTVAQLSTYSVALGELYLANGTTHAQVEVSDTAANISSALDSLSSGSLVNKIVISDNAALHLSATQVVGDSTLLAATSNANLSSYSIIVTDTAANITSSLNGLQSNGHVTSITVSDNQEITVSVAQLTSDATVIGELANANSSTVHLIVSDTAAHISAAFDSLNGNTTVNKIIVSDSGANEVSITVAQLTADAVALGELFLANGSTLANVAISDTGAHITSAIASLNSASRVNNIIISNNVALSLTATQVGADTTALNELHNQNGSSVVINVSDTAANVSSHIDQLEAQVSKLGSILLTDGGTPTVTVTQTQDTNDASVLGKIHGPFDLHVTNVTGHAYTSFTNFYDSTNTLTLTTQFNSNGSITDIAHTNSLSLTGTNGADTFDIVAGHSDTISGGSGADVFEFTGVAGSTSTNYATIIGFNASTDKFELGVNVTGVNSAVSGALNSGAKFDTNLASALTSTHLGAHHAVLFTATSGSLSGDVFLVVDANGQAGYQAGQDYVFLLENGSHLNALAASDFM